MIASIIAAGFGLIFSLIGIACTLFWLWMLIHSITNKGLGDGEKIAWVLAVIFLPFLGSILYFFIGRPKGAGAL
jgi:hypothetical protein